MGYEAALQVSSIGQVTAMGKQHKYLGMGISFSLHMLAVSSVVAMSSAFSSFTPPLRIDFSIHKPYAVTKVEKVTAAIAQKPERVTARPQQVAPPPESVPEKVQEVVPVKITPLLTKRKIAVTVPPLITKKELIPEKSIEAPSQPPTKIVHEQEITPEESVVNNSVTQDAEPEQKGVGSVATQEKQYLKEHFLYIKDSIQSNISYPRMARKMGWQGRVLVSFIICRDGSVKDIRIIKSSGVKALDKNAVKVIQKIAPFPKPPVAAELIIPVTYKLS